MSRSLEHGEDTEISETTKKAFTFLTKWGGTAMGVAVGYCVMNPESRELAAQAMEGLQHIDTQTVREVIEAAYNIVAIGVGGGVGYAVGRGIGWLGVGGSEAPPEYQPALSRSEEQRRIALAQQRAEEYRVVPVRNQRHVPFKGPARVQPKDIRRDDDTFDQGGTSYWSS